MTRRFQGNLRRDRKIVGAADAVRWRRPLFLPDPAASNDFGVAERRPFRSRQRAAPGRAAMVRAVRPRFDPLPFLPVTRHASRGTRNATAPDASIDRAPQGPGSLPPPEGGLPAQRTRTTPTSCGLAVRAANVTTAATRSHPPSSFSTGRASGLSRRAPTRPPGPRILLSHRRTAGEIEGRRSRRSRPESAALKKPPSLRAHGRNLRLRPGSAPIPRAPCGGRRTTTVPTPPGGRSCPASVDDPQDDPFPVGGRRPQSPAFSVRLRPCESSSTGPLRPRRMPEIAEELAFGKCR